MARSLGHAQFRITHFLFIYEQTLFKFSNIQLQQRIHFLRKPFFIHPAVPNATRKTKQSKSLLLVNRNYGCLIFLAGKDCSQVAWFQSTNIFQRSYFYFVVDCLAVRYTLHGASIQHVSWNAKQGLQQNRSMEFLGTRFSFNN